MSLQDLLKKSKSDEVFIIVTIVLVGIGAFGLGRLSKIESLRQGLSIEAPAQVSEALIKKNTNIKNDKNIENTGLLEGSVVASKSGTKYHFPWCTGAKSISEKNKIWFNSVTEAKEAGYSPASNCKGLK
jgi:hypothetical protein